jgi:hypothetical protein
MAMTASGSPEADEVRSVLSERAWKVKNKHAKELTEGMTKDRIDQWAREATRPGRRLGYETVSGQGDIVALLKKPGAAGWTEFTVPMSMREVEPAVQLIMDDTIHTDPPQWEYRKTKPDGDAE